MWIVMTAAQAVTLSVQIIMGARLEHAAAIVGRAACSADSTVLLTSLGEVIAVSSRPSPSVRVTRSSELAAQPALWGLACLADGSLWTLATGHSLARIGPDGRVTRRVALTLPWVALFGRGPALLYQALPAVAGSPILATTAPADVAQTAAWPGLLGRAVPGGQASIAGNLVKCGIDAAGWQPCWFADADVVSLSNGHDTRDVRVPARERRTLDASMPVRDVAAVDRSRTWLLGTSVDAARLRRGADVAMVVDDGGPSGHVALTPAARVILFASFHRCVVLASDGRLLEITAP
jgi:hypothetical protein